MTRRTGRLSPDVWARDAAFSVTCGRDYASFRWRFLRTCSERGAVSDDDLQC